MPKSDLPRKLKASFVEPILLQRCAELPDGKPWLIELKLDGFRAIAFKTGGRVYLRSRKNKDFNGRYPTIVAGLSGMPDDTVLDGEIVALDESGRSSFNVLENYGSSQVPILYYVLDVMMLAGRDLTTKTLDERRDLLEARVLPKLKEPIRQSSELKGKIAEFGPLRQGSRVRRAYCQTAEQRV